MPEEANTEESGVRAFIERSIGKAVFVAIPTVLLFLAGWIWSVEGKIARIETSNKENSAQWKVLYENREQIDELQIEVEVYKRLFGMMVSKGKIEPKVPPEKYGSMPKEPIEKEPEALHERKLEDFKQQQMKIFTEQMQAPDWKK